MGNNRDKLEEMIMTAEQNKAIIERFVEEVQNGHNLDMVEEVMSPGMIDHFYEGQGLPHPPNAVEAFKQFYTGMLQAFPDLQVVVHDMIAEGDRVFTYKSFQGTHQGEFKGIPATGRRISVDVMDVFRLANGKMVEHWVVADWMGLLQQIGALPLSKKLREFR